MILGKKREMNAKLVVESSVLSSSELVSAFNVTPFRRWSIGEAVVRPHKTLHEKSHGFLLHSRLPSDENVEDHLADLCAQLGNVSTGGIGQFRNEYAAEFRIGIDLFSGAEIHVKLGRNFLTMASIIGAAIDIDILHLSSQSAKDDFHTYDTLVRVNAGRSTHCLFNARGIDAFDRFVAYSYKLVKLTPSKLPTEFIVHVTGAAPILNMPVDFIALLDKHGMSVRFILRDAE